MKIPFFLISSGLLMMAAACTPDLDTSATPDEFQSEVVTLTPAAPRFEQRLALWASPKEGKQVRIGRASLMLEVEHEWKGLDGGDAGVNPWLRVRILDERDGSIFDEMTVLANDPRVTSIHPMRFYGPNRSLCERSEPRCEVTFHIEIERQGTPAEGTVDVQWKAIGYADADEAQGSDIAVRLLRVFRI